MDHPLLTDARTQAVFLFWCAVVLAAGGYFFGQRGGDEVVSLPFGDQAPVQVDVVESVPTTTTATVAPGPAAAAPSFSVDTVSGESSVRTISLTGSADEGTRVFVPGGEAVSTSVGDWSAPVVLEPGPNEVLVEGLGTTGEIASEIISINYEPGTLPAVDFSAQQEFRVSSDIEPWEFFSGTATPLSDVAVTSTFGTASTTADENGDWSLPIFFDVPGSDRPFDVVVEGVNGTETFTFVHSPDF